MSHLTSCKNMVDIKNIWIQEPVIYDYFLKFNQGDFQGVSHLFEKYGSLDAPFQHRLYGRTAIYDYLQKEAKGMKALPQSGTIETLTQESIQYQLQGQVQTSLFTINVSWTIELNKFKEITSVTVKLLAELHELFNLRQ